MQMEATNAIDHVFAEAEASEQKKPKKFGTVISFAERAEA